MTIYPSGVIVFVIFCLLFVAALTDPTWMRIAEAVVSVLIALRIAGFLSPTLLKNVRGL